ncbi:MAG: ABC transporter ATP-binding protein [Desulfuromonadales bacterium]|nr:ABC transporter ATP-binding protein [Desulfuromonadales bacterium]
MPLVELTGVSKVFHSQSGPIQALTDCNVVVDEGEFLCIVGPSGCGKSTLLNIIAGLETPDSGSVLVKSKPVTGPGPDRMVMFQEAALFPWLNVIQNVAFGLKMAGMGRKERRERAVALLAMVKLSVFSRSWIHELSGGMKQRVALASALAHDPGILLMDEPFAALDAQMRDQLHVELESIWQKTGKTILFVTHNVREAVRLGTRVLLMTARDGRIKREYPIGLPRHRQLEDIDLVKIASVIRDDLRQEVIQSNKREYIV